MYRAVTLAARERGLDLADGEQLAQLVGEIRVELVGDRVLLDGNDVTTAIRKFDITTAIHYAADNPAVRSQLVVWQRAAAADDNVVTEGRDQGTVVFPDAECKIFLTADEAGTGPAPARRFAGPRRRIFRSTKCSPISGCATSAICRGRSAALGEGRRRDRSFDRRPVARRSRRPARNKSCGRRQ